MNGCKVAEKIGILKVNIVPIIYKFLVGKSIFRTDVRKTIFFSVRRQKLLTNSIHLTRVIACDSMSFCFSQYQQAQVRLSVERLYVFQHPRNTREHYQQGHIQDQLHFHLKK